MFKDDVRRGIEVAAKSLKIEAAALLAVADVESGGQAYAIINGQREPLIRFEGHYFDKRLTLAKRKKARALGLSSATVGGLKALSTGQWCEVVYNGSGYTLVAYGTL